MSQKEKKSAKRKKIDKKDEKIVELTQDLQRIHADFVNFKRRAEEERISAANSGKLAAVHQLLPFIDSTSRAMEHIPQDLEGHDFVKGIKSMAKQLDDALNKLNVQKIETVDATFNPELMEAVSMEDQGGEEEIVSEELQTGYTLNGALIRHAMVKVIKK